MYTIAALFFIVAAIGAALIVYGLWPTITISGINIAASSVLTCAVLWRLSYGSWQSLFVRHHFALDQYGLVSFLFWLIMSVVFWLTLRALHLGREHAILLEDSRRLRASLDSESNGDKERRTAYAKDTEGYDTRYTAAPPADLPDGGSDHPTDTGDRPDSWPGHPSA